MTLLLLFTKKFKAFEATFLKKNKVLNGAITKVISPIIHGILN